MEVCRRIQQVKKQVSADWKTETEIQTQTDNNTPTETQIDRRTAEQTHCTTDDRWADEPIGKIREDDAELIKIPHLEAVQCSAFRVTVTSDPFTEESIWWNVSLNIKQGRIKAFFIWFFRKKTLTLKSN